MGSHAPPAAAPRRQAAAWPDAGRDARVRLPGVHTGGLPGDQRGTGRPPAPPVAVGGRRPRARARTGCRGSRGSLHVQLLRQRHVPRSRARSHRRAGGSRPAPRRRPLRDRATPALARPARVGRAAGTRDPGGIAAVARARRGCLRSDPPAHDARPWSNGTCRSARHGTRCSMPVCPRRSAWIPRGSSSTMPVGPGPARPPPHRRAHVGSTSPGPSAADTRPDLRSCRCPEAKTAGGSQPTGA